MSSLWLGFDTESDVTQWAYEPGLPVSAAVLEESLAALVRLTEILRAHQVKATFFLVGRLLEVAGDAYRVLLQGEGHDLECHTYSHHPIHAGHPLSESPAEAEKSIRRGLDLMEQWFGERPLGLCAPGGSPTGLRRQPEILRVIWEAGLRFVKSDNLASSETPMLPSRIHPYAYAEEGYPDLWRLPGVGWHCTLTLPRAPGDWTPRPVVPGGPPFPHAPRTPEDHLAWVRQELDYVRAHGCQFSPSWHPWSLYRFDPSLTVVDFLLTYAREHKMPVKTYRQVYEELAGGPEPVGGPGRLG